MVQLGTRNVYVTWSCTSLHKIKTINKIRLHNINGHKKLYTVQSGCNIQPEVVQYGRGYIQYAQILMVGISNTGSFIIREYQWNIRVFCNLCLTMLFQFEFIGLCQVCFRVKYIKSLSLLSASVGTLENTMLLS